MILLRPLLLPIASIGLMVTLSFAASAESANAEGGTTTAQQPAAPAPEVEAGDGESHDGCPFDREDKEKPVTG